jgi:HEAT repeat protein
LYYLNESLAGKKVRCKHCADTFPVEMAGALPTGDAAAQEEAPALQVSASRRGVPVDHAADEELLEVTPAPERKRSVKREPDKEGGGFPWVLLFFGGVALVILLLCGGIGTGIFFIIYNVHQAVNNVSARMNNMNPAFGPQTVNEAVADLQSGDIWQEQRAAQWLASTPSNPADQPRVSQALEPLLKDPFVKIDAANALVVWGGPNNVPALIRCVETNDFGTSDPAMKALVNIRDKRAAAPLARLLADWVRRESAANALQTLGPMCQDEVLKYAFDADNPTRDKAQRLLSDYGTQFDAYLPQLRTDLKHVTPARRSAAAAWLAQQPVVLARQPEVAAMLDPVLYDLDPGTRNSAVRAAKVWATKDNVPALVKYLNDKIIDGQVPEETWMAMEALVRLKDEFKDESAYWAIAQYCENFFHGPQACKYLVKIGAAAEPEVAKRLSDRDAKIRKRAWVALAVVGTKANLANYQALAGAEMDFGMKNEANKAISTITARR